MNPVLKLLAINFIQKFDLISPQTLVFSAIATTGKNFQMKEAVDVLQSLEKEGVIKIRHEAGPVYARKEM